MKMERGIWEQISNTHAIRVARKMKDGKEYGDEISAVQIAPFEEIEALGDIVEYWEHSNSEGRNLYEKDTIELIVSFGFVENEQGERVVDPDVPKTAPLHIGIDEKSMDVFDDEKATKAVEGVTFEIDGTFGAKTLDFIARQAERENLLVTDVHFDADNDTFFTGKFHHKQFRRSGEIDRVTPHKFPRSTSQDEHTTIRTMAGLQALLDSYGFLEYKMYKGNEVRFDFDVVYMAKK